LNEGGRLGRLSQTGRITKVKLRINALHAKKSFRARPKQGPASELYKTSSLPIGILICIHAKLPHLRVHIDFLYDKDVYQV